MYSKNGFKVLTHHCFLRLLRSEGVGYGRLRYNNNLHSSIDRHRGGSVNMQMNPIGALQYYILPLLCLSIRMGMMEELMADTQNRIDSRRRLVRGGVWSGSSFRVRRISLIIV